jgi:phosphohistidine phosphatase
MAELILMRHAAALPAAIGTTDFERALSAPGRAAAAQAARRLATAGLTVQRLLYSPAQRTRDTAAIVARELSLDPAALQSVAELYAASPRSIRESIEQYHGNALTLMVIGHNPGLSELGHELDSALARHHLPTAAFWRLSLDAGSWQRMTRPIGAQALSPR